MTDDPALLLAAQRRAFAAHPPLTAAQRRAALDALAQAILRWQDRLCAAVAEDFGHRPETETRMLEILPVLDEIAHLRRRLGGWMRPRRVSVGWRFLPSRARILRQPLGVVGIMAPWNYPLMLTLSPLANALAAGNHAMLKPSDLSPASAAALGAMLAEAFPESYVAVCPGDAELAAAFSALPFDHLIFTGSPRVGRLVMAAAARNLTPVTLELGGKSPAILHESYPVARAAERICGAKLWNAGQTCIAPDYVLVPEARLEAFVAACEAALRRLLPAGRAGRDMAALVGPAAQARMEVLLAEAQESGARIVRVDPGGEGTLPPTLVIAPDPELGLMREEIFGPVLPVLPVPDTAAAIGFVNARPRPLALYYFDDDRTRVEHLLATTVSGGVTVNDCIYHIAQHALPFGGVGESGIGAYRGEHGFRRFSHEKAVLLQSRLTGRLLALATKPPYAAWKRRAVALMTGRARKAPARFDPGA